MHIKAAQIDDSKMIFEWANDLQVRRMAFSCEKIKREAHKEWFQKKLNSPYSFIYIAVKNNQPVGQIRFDVTCDNKANVDVHTGPCTRAKGLGSKIIALGTRRFFKDCTVNEVHAVIKEENVISRRAFQKAGFKELSRKTVHGISCFHMVKKRS